MREEAALALIQTLVGVPRQLCRVLSHVHFTSCVRMIYSGRIMWRYRNRAWGGVGDGVSAGPGAHRGPRRGFEVDSGSVRQSHSRSINSLQRNLKRRRELSSSPPLLSPSLCLSTFVCFNFSVRLLLSGLCLNHFNSRDSFLFLFSCIDTKLSVLQCLQCRHWWKHVFVSLKTLCNKWWIQ